MFFLSQIFSLGLLISLGGLIYAYKKKRKKKNWLIGIVVCTIFFNIFNPNPISTKTGSPAPKVSQEKKEPVKELSEDEKIKKICQDTLKDNFISVQITNDETEGGKILTITTKGNENLTNSMTRKGTLWQSRDLFKNLYTSGIPIIICSIESSLPLIDSYGNTKDGVVMRCVLNNDVAKHIAWENVELIQWEKILNEYWIHPALKKDE